MMNTRICVYNLGTEATVYGDVFSREDISKLYKEVNPHGWNDCEVQLMDSDYNLNDDNVESFFRLVEEFPDVDPINISLLYHVGDTREVERMLENEVAMTFITAKDKETAFIQYYEEMGYEMPSGALAEYVDWDRVMRDFEIRGLDIVELGLSKSRKIGEMFFEDYMFVG